MKPLQLCLTALSVFPILCLEASLAGPVSRELNALGGSVGTPKPRPPTAAEQMTSPVQSIPQTGNQSAAPETERIPQDPEQNVTSVDNCISELQQTAVVSASPQPVGTDSVCQIPNPVELKRSSGAFPVQFSKGLTLDCRFASTFNNFVQNTLQPLARHHMGSAVTAIGSGQGYICRRRNNAATGKLSEHAFGNAIDLISFSFANGRGLSIKSDQLMGPDEQAFFDSLRAAACGSFTTVLGPGTNQAHATHLHLDLGRTGEKKNPYRICE